MSLLKYLKEREEYFYPEEEREELEDEMEEPEDDYGLDFVDDETFNAEEIEVEEIPDNSDPVLDASEFMPNSELQRIYSKGKGLDITDNQDLYEVIKLVKDMTDKHLYMRDMTWKVDIANRKANFTFKVDSVNSDDFFLKGIQQYVVQEIFKKFGPLYKVDTKYLKDNKGNSIMELKVEKEEDTERRDLKKMILRSPKSNSFINQGSSVSRI